MVALTWSFQFSKEHRHQLRSNYKNAEGAMGVYAERSQPSGLKLDSQRDWPLGRPRHSVGGAQNLASSLGHMDIWHTGQFFLQDHEEGMKVKANMGAKHRHTHSFPPTFLVLAGLINRDRSTENPILIRAHGEFT